MTKLIETDVLVIGGGIAAGFAAIGAKEYPVEVAVVDKGTFGRSGCAALASGVWHCYLPGDDFEQWYKEYIDEGIRLLDQRLLKKAIVETAKAMKKMDEWGVKWAKKDGKFVRTKAHGDSVPRNAVMAEGGPQMMLAVRQEALRRGVKAINKVMITDLITSDGKHPTKGKVVGAIGFHAQTGETCVFQAKSVIMASGGIKGLPYAKIGQPIGVSIVPNNLTGDGYAMAFRVGAALTNMELVLATRGAHMRDFTCAPSMNLLFGQGAKLTNRLGERFMEKYDPVRKESAHRWVTGVAVAKEERDGRGPVVLDCTEFTPEKIKLCKMGIPLIMESLEKGGYDITKDKVAYEADYLGGSLSGDCGIRTNEKGESSIAGLYAAGAATVTSLVALPGCSISGWHAGENAAAYSLSINSTLIGGKVAEQTEKLKADIMAPLQLKDGLDFSEVQGNLARIIRDDIGIFMSEGMLSKAGNKLADVEKQGLRATNYHELTKVIGMRNFVQALEIAVSAARRRTESRGGFVRQDYPETDNINWLKCISLRREDSGIRFWEEPIPAEEEIPVERKKVLHKVFRVEK